MDASSSILGPRSTLGAAVLPAMVVVGFILAITGQARVATAQGQVSKEYEVKAAFLVKFTQFTEWPADAFDEAKAPFVIGVLGDDPFGDALDQVVRGETVGNRPVVVKRSRQVDDLRTCHVLFVGQSEKAKAAEILAKVDSAAMLTVGETDGFAQRGGVVNFYLDGGKVRFEINPDAAKRNRLKLSSQLLKLGKIVHR